MKSGRNLLETTSTLPLVLATLGGALVAGPAGAACTTVGATTRCDATLPDPYTATIGTGRLDHGRTVVVEGDATIAVVNRNAISLGNGAVVTLDPGATVRGDVDGGSGLYGTGPQPIEFGSNGTLTVGEGASVVVRGTQHQSEAVNVHGFGNRIENHGLISGEPSAAIWFQDEQTGTKNVVDNFGTIEQVNGGTVIGTSGGSGIDFYNRTGAVVDGALRFAGGDDSLYFFAGSTVTGAIDGGAGADSLTLTGTDGTDDTLQGAIAGFEALTKDGLGRWTITEALSGFQSTTVAAGTLALTGDNLGYAAGVVINPLGTLEARAQSLPAQADPAANVDNIRNDGRLRFAQPDEGSYAGQIVGAGVVEKTGAGVTTLAPSAGANTYAGGTEIYGGTIAVAADAALGDATGGITLDGGALRTTASFATARGFTLGDGGGTVETVDGTTLMTGGTLAGPGGLTKTGGGTLALTGANAYAGGTEIDGGTVEVASNVALGAATGTLGLDRGTLRTTVGFRTTRATTLGPGGGIIDTAAGTLTDAGTIAGGGPLTKAGDGMLVLRGTNAYAGATTVAAGTLEVDGNQRAATGATTARAGTTLAGTGTIGGNVTVADGATLSPGRLGGAGTGRLAVAGDLTIAEGATLAYAFGQANVVGGTLNDLTTVGGDLTLDGTLNVTTSAGGTFGPGVYRVISYRGAITDNGLAIGTIPSPDFLVQTSIAGQVNLVNATGLTLTYWDGDAGPKDDGVIDGGDGSWQASAGNDDWTEAMGSVNAPWADGDFAVFAGAAGTVTVDDALGVVTASGLQFATDGYVLSGDDLTLVGTPDSIVRVGDGTTAGAGITATIATALTGDTRLVKTDVGTLVLSDANGYTGGTAVDGGTLEIADDGNLGAAGTGLSLDGGTLRPSQSLTLARATIIGAAGGTFETGSGVTLAQAGDTAGVGQLIKTGAGTLTMTGTGTYEGGTRIAAGTLRVGGGGTAGSIVGDVTNAGTLVFDRSDAVDFAGAIAGRGAVRQEGTGTVTLSGANVYSGATTVAAGTLAAGETNAFSAASAHVIGASGTLDVGDRDQRVARLANAGRVTLGGVPGTRLTVGGDYVGQGGVLHFTTALAGDASPTDRLIVEGDTSGTGVIEVENADGIGGPTVEGIKLVDVAGASDATFTLAGDVTFDGNTAIISGAYAYSLWQGGASTPDDGDWYLRSQSTIQPGAPVVQPGVPTYEAYPLTLLALNGLPTMQERVGNRYWQGAGNPTALGGMADAGVTALPAGGSTENHRSWMRVEGSRVTLRPDGGLAGTPDYDMDVWKLQVGIDGAVQEADDGVVIGGVTFDYGKASNEIGADAGDGSIDTEGYGFGGTLTWLGDDDLYVDGQVQATWYDSDVSTDTSGRIASGNDGFGYAAGVEVGKRLQWRDNWTVTPQAQLVYSSVDFDSFTDSFDARVRSDDGATMPLRVGLALDQERGWKAASDGDGRRTHFYGIANLTYDLMDGTSVTIAGDGFSSDADRLWGSVGVGGTYSWGDGAYAIYGEGLVRSSLENFADSYANTATVGFRMAF